MQSPALHGGSVAIGPKIPGSFVITASTPASRRRLARGVDRPGPDRAPTRGPARPQRARRPRGGASAPPPRAASIAGTRRASAARSLRIRADHRPQTRGARRRSDPRGRCARSDPGATWPTTRLGRGSADDRPRASPCRWSAAASSSSRVASLRSTCTPTPGARRGTRAPRRASAARARARAARRASGRARCPSPRRGSPRAGRPSARARAGRRRGRARRTRSRRHRRRPPPSKERRVFSGASAAAPRWPTRISGPCSPRSSLIVRSRSRRQEVLVELAAARRVLDDHPVGHPLDGRAVVRPRASALLAHDLERRARAASRSGRAPPARRPRRRRARPAARPGRRARCTTLLKRSAGQTQTWSNSCRSVPVIPSSRLVVAGHRRDVERQDAAGRRAARARARKNSRVAR